MPTKHIPNVTPDPHWKGAYDKDFSLVLDDDDGDGVAVGELELGEILFIYKLQGSCTGTLPTFRVEFYDSELARDSADADGLVYNSGDQVTSYVENESSGVRTIAYACNDGTSKLWCRAVCPANEAVTLDMSVIRMR